MATLFHPWISFAVIEHAAFFTRGRPTTEHLRLARGLFESTSVRNSTNWNKTKRRLRPHVRSLLNSNRCLPSPRKVLSDSIKRAFYPAGVITMSACLTACHTIIISSLPVRFRIHKSEVKPTQIKQSTLVQTLCNQNRHNLHGIHFPKSEFKMWNVHGQSETG